MIELDQRQFKKLRISLTNLCNLACTYCVPEKYSSGKNIPDLIEVATVNPEYTLQRLSTEELLKLASMLHKKLALKEVRLTGGEPLLHPELPSLINGLKSVGIAKVGITTNGFLLPVLAQKLANAGLDNVNISLDAMDPEIFLQITRKNYLNKVLKGIDKAIDEGLNVKINSVILRGVNCSQIIPLLEYAHTKQLTIRYIELMKMGHLYNSNTNLLYSANEMLEDIRSVYSIIKLPRKSSSTANYWKINTRQKFGIIANESMPFCSDCDRLRLDEYGRVFGCISSNKGFSVKDHINNEDQLESALNGALRTKKRYFTGSHRSMINLGG